MFATAARDKTVSKFPRLLLLLLHLARALKTRGFLGEDLEAGRGISHKEVEQYGYHQGPGVSDRIGLPASRF